MNPYTIKFSGKTFVKNVLFQIKINKKKIYLKNKSTVEILRNNI